MITLLIDALIAAVKLIDRGLSAVENRVSPADPPPVVADAQQPTGAGSWQIAGAGGQPRDTSEVLHHAARELTHIYGNRMPAVICGLVAELRDHEAQLRAVGC